MWFGEFSLLTMNQDPLLLVHLGWPSSVISRTAPVYCKSVGRNPEKALKIQKDYYRAGGKDEEPPA